MTLLVDAQLSPSLALWVTARFEIDCFSLKYIGYRDADDIDIFFKARELDAIVLTKDEDFVKLLHQHGSPPRIIWLTCGNTSNARMREILEAYLETALEMLQANEMVEISG
jgi:predicted nuclease of predicted toxin-antitoxin system